MWKFQLDAIPVFGIADPKAVEDGRTVCVDAKKTSIPADRHAQRDFATRMISSIGPKTTWSRRSNLTVYALMLDSGTLRVASRF